MKSAIRNYALLFVGCMLLHIAGTWSLPLIDRDEPRFAEASREMIQRGDYVVPYFNNRLRLDKPPLTYWAQVASYRIFGENDFAARLPSSVAAALIALSLLAWGSRIAGRRVGWWAAIIFTLSLQTFLHAKAAVADMWLVLFMTVAHWAGYELLQRPTPNSDKSRAGAQRSTPNKRAAVSKHLWVTDKTPFFAFYLSLALGFLAKGPIAWIPLLTVLAMIVSVRNLQLVRRCKFLSGTLMMLAVVALWGIPALIQTDGQFFAVGIGRHVIGRSLATMEGHGASSFATYLVLLPFYFVTIFVSFFPWSIKLPWLARTLWRKHAGGVSDPGASNRGKIDIYLLTGITIIFAIFTLVSTKLPHYTLPAFPLLALLLARHWQGAAAITNRGSSFKTIAVATGCIWIAIALLIPPLVARFFPAYQLFQESRTYLRPDMQFASVNFNEPSLVWYFRSRVNGFLTPLSDRRAAEFMEKQGPRLLVLPTSMVPTVFGNPPENWKMFSMQGFNIPKGKRVELTLVLKLE